MPCYRCGARQLDPVRGPSPWKRGVQSGEQVLVCPDCQRGRDWAADLDRCPRCGSTQLARRLGETTCRACGGTVPPGPSAARAEAEPPHAAGGPPADAPGALARDVAAALSRVLGRPEDISDQR